MNNTVRLGALDPRFFGIRMFFANIADFEFAKGVYTQNISPVALARSRSSGTLSDHQMWIATAVEHEFRHFHDSLLSSHWLAILLLRNQSACNVITLLYDLVANGQGNCIPIPLRKWLRMGTKHRDERVRSWSRSGRWKPVPMPVLPPPRGSSSVDLLLADGASLFYSAIMGHDRIEGLWRGRSTDYSGDLTPRHVYELSALMTQIAAAHESFAYEDAANDLRRSLQTTATHYGAVLLKVLSTLLASPGVHPANVIVVASAVATWALIGPLDLATDADGRMRTDRELNFSCPAYRLAFALDIVSEYGISDADPIMIIEFLERKAGSMPYLEALRWKCAVLHRSRTHYINLRSHMPEREDVVVVADFLALLAAGQQRMVDDFIAAPSDYICPQAYLKRIETYILPAIALTLEGEEDMLLTLGGGSPEAILTKYESLQKIVDFVTTGKVAFDDGGVIRAFLESELGLPAFTV